MNNAVSSPPPSKSKRQQMMQELAEPVAGRSLRQLAMRRLLRNKAAMVSLIVLCLIVTSSLLVPIFSPEFNYPFQSNVWPGETIDYSDDAQYCTAERGGDCSVTHWLGTGRNGRDNLTNVMMGGRISLLIGVAGTLICLVIGILYGALSGYIGGRTDAVMMRVVDVLYGIPFMFVLILLMVLFEGGIYMIFIAIGMVNWLDMARIVRGQTLSLKRREFVEAAQALGVPTRQIIFRHIIPNLLGIAVIYITLMVPQVILVESFLSFLGIGVEHPDVSWGQLVSQGTDRVMAERWEPPLHLLWPSALLLAVTLYAFNFIGDGLRDALDPKDR